MQQPQVRAFKYELRNYRFYQSRIEKLNELIDFCYTLLPGSVHGIDLADIRTHGTPNKEREYRIRDEISKHERNLRHVEEKKEYLDEILDKMEEELREAVKCVYVDGKTMIETADKYDLSATGLQYRIDTEIMRVLNGETEL